MPTCPQNISPEVYWKIPTFPRLILGILHWAYITGGGRAYQFRNYRHVVDFVANYRCVPSKLFLKLQIFFSVRWFDHRILCKIYLNHCFIARKIVKYRTIVRPPHKYFLKNSNSPSQYLFIFLESYRTSFFFWNGEGRHLRF